MSDATAPLAVKIVDGDIFRWRYKDEKPEQLGAYGRYHCKSQIAIATGGGWLEDTFWHGGSDVCWTYADAERDLELTRLGNLNELEKRPEYEAAYYADEDCVDLNHSNSSRGNFYVRKGAIRSREKMIRIAEERWAEAEREAKFASERAERYRLMVGDLVGGKSLDEVYL